MEGVGALLRTPDGGQAAWFFNMEVKKMEGWVAAAQHGFLT